MGAKSFIQLPKVVFESAAWKCMSHGGRLFNIALRSFLNGKINNNGALFLSARNGAEQLGSGKKQIARWARENQHYGFTVETVAADRTTAAHFRLTDLPCGDQPPTNDFLHWSGTPFDRRGMNLPPRQKAELAPAGGVINDPTLNSGGGVKNDPTGGVKHYPTGGVINDPIIRKKNKIKNKMNNTHGVSEILKNKEAPQSTRQQSSPFDRQPSWQPPNRRPAAPAAEPRFKETLDAFWGAYPHRQGDPYAAAAKEWKKLTVEDRDRAMRLLPYFIKAQDKIEHNKFVPFACRYLADRRFDAFAEKHDRLTKLQEASQRYTQRRQALQDDDSLSETERQARLEELTKRYAEECKPLEYIPLTKSGRFMRTY